MAYIFRVIVSATSMRADVADRRRVSRRRFQGYTA